MRVLPKSHDGVSKSSDNQLDQSGRGCQPVAPPACSGDQASMTYMTYMASIRRRAAVDAAVVARMP